MIKIDYKKLNIAAMIIVPISLFVILKIVSRDFSKPNYQYLNDMAESAAYIGQEKNPLYKDGISERVQPAGSIARSSSTFNFGASDSERDRAGKELKNPIQLTPLNLQRGKFLFERFCMVCHGERGGGDGPLIPKYPNPPSFKTEKFKILSDGAIYHTVVYGKNKMPSHASQISDLDRWKIILYINKLRQE